MTERVSSLAYSNSYFDKVVPINKVDAVTSNDLVEIVDHSLTEAIYRCSEDGRILYVNDAFLNLFNVNDKSEIVGKKASNYYKDRSVLKAVNEELSGTSKTFNGEVQFVKEGGKSFYGFLSSRKVVRDKTVYVDGVIRDISDEKKSKAKLEQQAKIQNLLLKISTSFLNADLENANSVINKSLKGIGDFFKVNHIQVFEYKPEHRNYELAQSWISNSGENYSQSKELPKEWIDELVSLHEMGHNVSFPLKSSGNNQATDKRKSLTVPMKSDGQYVGFLLLSDFSFDFSDSLISMLMLFANMIASLSLRSKNHNNLKHLIGQVTQNSQRHKEFSFITSHNIRASVANLLAISDLMRQESSDMYVDMLSSTVSHLNDSITNLNQVLHLEHHHFFKRSTCNIRSSVERALEALRFVINENQIEVDNLVSRSLELKTLPSYLDNILMQIISNAIKYGTNDDSRVVKIKATQLQGSISIIVEDFGEGFDVTKHSDQLFKVGSRFHKDKGDGHGLGLYISHQQISSLGGVIGIDSVKGKGTKVLLTFPDELSE